MAHSVLVLPMEARMTLQDLTGSVTILLVTHLCATSTKAGAVAMELTWFSV
jgi:hypothetical protein